MCVYAWFDAMCVVCFCSCMSQACETCVPFKLWVICTVEYYSGTGTKFNTLTVYSVYLVKCLEVKVNFTVNFINVFIL